MKLCNQVNRWLEDYPGEPIPDWIWAHTNECANCREAITLTRILRTWETSQENSSLAFTPEQDWRVRNTIQTVSSSIQKKTISTKKKQTALRWVFSCAFSCFLLLTGFLYIPFVNHQSVYMLVMNERMKTTLSQNDRLLSVDTSSQAEILQTLQFANLYCETEEERQFLYSNNESSRNRLLFVKFVAERSELSYAEIYHYVIQDQYSEVLHEAKLPLYQTWKHFTAYRDMYRLLPGDAYVSLDATVVSFDYETGTVLLDALVESVYCDFVSIQQLYPSQTYHFVIKKQRDTWSITTIDSATTDDSVVISKQISWKDNLLLLEDFPHPIYVSNRTMQEESFSLQENSEDTFLARIREVSKEQWIALSLTKITKPLERTLSGTVNQGFKNGFILDSMGLTFSFSSPGQKILSPGDVVTLQGHDYGSFFVVQKIVSLIPYKELSHDYLVASVTSVEQTEVHQPISQKTPRSLSPPKQILQEIPPSPSVSDIVVGLEGDTYFFLSGKTVMRECINTSISIGDSLRYSEKEGQIEISSHFSNKPHVVQYNASVIETLPNGIVILNSSDGNRIYVYGQEIHDTNIFTFQGKVISYGSINIALEWRVFSTTKLVNIQGMITREIEKDSLYQLDNGSILKVDDLTEIQGELQVGRIVKIAGSYEQGVLEGYIIRVEKEILLIQGEIVTWNEKEKWCLLDTGIRVYMNDATIYHGEGFLEEGITIYCKVYKKEGLYIVTDLAWKEKEISGTGEWI